MGIKKGCRAHPFSFEDLLFPVLPLEDSCPPMTGEPKGVKKRGH